MTTVAVQDKFAEILTTFGDLQESVNAALQCYTIEQITTKISELRQKDSEYQTRYRLEYPAFSQRTAEDEEFVQHIESNINKMWEMDLVDWEFCYKGIDDWTRKLQDILLT
ncbi:MAG: hypothetical protein ISS57_13765 [Anaerolineales bacterium]|nr:hypothetical protein [Anaerolineales bacterium]